MQTGNIGAKAAVADVLAATPAAVPVLQPADAVEIRVSSEAPLLDKATVLAAAASIGLVIDCETTTRPRKAIILTANSLGLIRGFTKSSNDGAYLSPSLQLSKTICKSPS
jgi:hypothetical protein